jgi:arabinofuranosyltransferase
MQNSNRLLIASVLVTACICTYFTYKVRDYTFDDALIYHRYIQNVLEGNGLVYNVGEKFNGLTSYLHTYISIGAAFIFFGNIQYSQLALSGLCFFLTCCMLIPLFRNTIPDRLLLFFPPLMACNAYFYKTYGIETTMHMFLTVSALVLFVRGRYFVLAITCALLLLTRGESLFLIITLCGFHVCSRRPLPPFRVFVVPCVIFSFHFAFMYFYYGTLFPNTLSAKVLQGASGLWGRFAFLHHSHEFYSLFFNKNAWLVCALAVLSLPGICLAWRTTVGRIMLVYLVLHCSFYIVFNIPDYFWYYGYVFLAVYTFAFLGLEWIRRFLSSSRNAWVCKNYYAVVVVFFLILLVPQVRVSQQLLSGLQGALHYKVIGTWIEQNTAPDAKVACIEIGHIGWYSKRYIIDELGLVSPHNAELIGKRDFYGWLNYYTPDYIVTWVPLRPHEVSVQSLLDEGRYVLERQFDFDGWKFNLLRKATVAETKSPGSF